jgi:hypothetical protein
MTSILKYICYLCLISKKYYQMLTVDISLILLLIDPISIVMHWHDFSVYSSILLN